MKLLDQASFYFVGNLLAPQQVAFYFFVTLMTDAGGHLNLKICRMALFEIRYYL